MYAPAAHSIKVALLANARVLADQYLQHTYSRSFSLHAKADEEAIRRLLQCSAPWRLQIFLPI